MSSRTKKGLKGGRKITSKVKKVVRQLGFSAKTPKAWKKPKRKQKANGGMPMSVKGIAVPAAMGFRNRVGAPQINRGRTFVVRHTEYLDDLTPHPQFYMADTNVYSLNPGLSGNFPWLSSLASNFEQYRFKSLSFRYMSRVGSNTTGTVYMSTQLNPADAPFSDKQEMYSYTGTTSGMVWSSDRHNCLLRRSDPYKKYFVRTGTPPAGTDIQLYDQGVFSWAIISSASSSTVMGELLVDYEVEFYNPKRDPDLGSLGAVLATGELFAAGALEPYAPANQVVPMTIRSSYSESFDINGQTDGTFGQFPPGVYLVTTEFSQDDGVVAIVVNNGVHAATSTPVTVSELDLVNLLTDPLTDTAANVRQNIFWVEGGLWNLTSDITVQTSGGSANVNWTLTVIPTTVSFANALLMSDPALLRKEEKKRNSLIPFQIRTHGRKKERKEEKLRAVSPAKVHDTRHEKEVEEDAEERLRSASRDKKSRKIDFQKPDPEHGRK